MNLNSCPNHTCCVTSWAAHLRDKEKLCPTQQYLLHSNKAVLFGVGFFGGFFGYWGFFNSNAFVLEPWGGRPRSPSLCKQPPDSTPEQLSPELGQRHRNTQRQIDPIDLSESWEAHSPERPLLFHSAMKGPGSKLQRASFISWEGNDYGTLQNCSSSGIFQLV